MCGILGIASKYKDVNCDWFLSGQESLFHRGPDDRGDWWSPDGLVRLAHRRLSIVDLSPSGHQPMQSSNGDLSITFNGEIYNYKDLRDALILKGHTFCTNSDTEVVLVSYQEWGFDCVDYLNGMFAFAIYDRFQKKVFLARDRAGEKPLFFHHTQGVLRFASELKALLADQSLARRIDMESLDCYLAMGFVPGSRCILKGFNKLPPAHALFFDLMTGECTQWKYWQPPPFEIPIRPTNELGLLDELESLLEAAVKRQMISSDVPVGVLLSGGVDSSLITAMAARVIGRVNTFTIGFPGHRSFDETQHARLIANYFGTNHTELMAQDFSADLLPLLAKQFDEPIVDSSMIPTFLVSRLIRQHCKVALGGDGGDELFGGYAHHSRILWLQFALKYMPQFICNDIAHVANKCLPAGVRGRRWLQGLRVNLNTELPMLKGFDASSRERLLTGVEDFFETAETIHNAITPNQLDLLQRVTRMDFNNYLPEDILVKVDRASMLNSLEIRSPFLDLNILKFAFGAVPSNLKATRFDKKILLKRLAARILPSEFDRKRKQGFSIPLAHWLKSGPFRELFKSVLFDSDCIFNSAAIKNLFNDQDRGINNGERLFSLVIFEIWRREYGVTL